MNMEQAVRTVLGKYADFSGRAQRSEYWYWVLAVVIGSILTSIVDAIIGISLLNIVFTLAIVVPSIAVGVRRLHDISKSGWFYLLFLIPIVNIVLAIVWFALEDSHPDNEYGPNPKGATPGGPPPAYGNPPTA